MGRDCGSGVAIEYDKADGYLRLLLDDGSVLYVAACREVITSSW